MYSNEVHDRIFKAVRDEHEVRGETMKDVCLVKNVDEILTFMILNYLNVDRLFTFHLPFIQIF